MNLGDAFVNKAVPGVVPSHLWLVLSDPAAHPRVVLVNISSDDGGHDGLTPVAAGEHEFITHPSYIRWDKARVENVADIKRAIQGNNVIPKPALSPALLAGAEGLPQFKTCPE